VSVTVRRATVRDAAVVDAMVREIAEHEGDLQHVQLDAARWRDLLARPDVLVLLAEDDDGALGYTSATRQLHLWSGGDVLALDDLYVRPSARNRGVGEQLMRAVATYAAPESLLVRWQLYETNEGARRFYERIGATVRPKLIAAWRPEDYATPTPHHT
jgi:GNAT superfamily N-acetyltransferase